MKKCTINKIMSYVLIVAFLVMLIFPTQISATTVKKCDECTIVAHPELVSSYLDDDGNLVKKYDTGVEVIYYTDGTIILNDYTHLFSDVGSEKQTRAMTLIGIISFTLLTCDIVEWIDPKHRNPCNLVIDYIYQGTGGPPDGKYEVYATYVPGYIPGCEPRHSAPCNAGYYQYSIKKIG